MGVATLSRSAWKWPNASSITWEGLQWAVSWPEPELQRQGRGDRPFLSLRLLLASLHHLKSVCEWVIVVRAREAKAAGVSSRCSHQGIKTDVKLDWLLDQSRARSAWRWLRPRRTMIHLCGVLINHISLTQPQNSVERVAPCLTY